MSRTTIIRAIVSGCLALTPFIIAGCPMFETGSQEQVQRVRVEGFAIAPMSQLKTVSAFTGISPYSGEAAYRTNGIEALGQQGYVPNARITVLDGSLQPVPGIKEGATDGHGRFVLDLPPGRAYILRLDYGDDKSLGLFAFAKVTKNGKLKVKMDVPTTMAAHMLIRRISQLPALLNEFTNEEIDAIEGEVEEHLTPEDVPDLSQISSILDRVSKLEGRLAALETKVSELEKKVDGLIGKADPASPTPEPLPTPTPSPSPTATFTPSPSPSPQGTSPQLSTFSVQTNVSLTTSRALHTMHRVGNYIYVIGGETVYGSPLSSVERAPILLDGSIGPFSVVNGVTLTTPRGRHASAIINGYLYVFGGGRMGTSPVTTIERARINADGSLGTFSVVGGMSLANPRYEASAIVMGEKVYLVGGYNKDWLASIDEAPIYPDGSIGAFTNSSFTLPGKRAGYAWRMHQGSAFVVGGINAGYMNSIDILKGGSSGGLAQVSQLGTRMQSIRNVPSCEITVDHLIVLGGVSLDGKPSPTVEVAPINSNGTLGRFAYSKSLTTGRAGHTSMIVNDKLYVFGGYVPDKSQAVASIEMAVIN